MSQRNSEEILSDLKSVFGDRSGIIFHNLIANYVELCIYWDDYCVLFGTNEERFDLMKKSSRSFFENIERVLFDQILMSICRLADPIESSGYENISVAQLTKFKEHSGKKDELQKLICNLNHSSKFARDWRNKRIAHNDASLVLNKDVSLTVANRSKIKQAISDIHSIIAYTQRCIGVEYTESVIPTLGGARSLLITLYHGVARRNELFEARMNNMEFENPVYPAWLTDTK